MKKKRLLSLGLAIAMIFGSAAAVPESVFTQSTSITASAVRSGDYEYKVLKDGTVEVTSYYGKASAVTIPSKLGGRKVTSIGENLFNHCDLEQIRSVVIPNTVTTIQAGAFFMMPNISKITIPKSVVKIGGGAFECTKWLENQIKKNPLVVVNGILVDGTCCKGFANIPSNVTEIADDAFGGVLGNNLDLTGVSIPDSVKSIGEYAFFGCKNVKTVIIPKSVKTIGERAFGYYDASFWDNDGVYNARIRVIENLNFYCYEGTGGSKYLNENGFSYNVLPNEKRFAGSDRAETAALISNANKGGMYKTAKTVVIATGFDFHDALAAVPLARAYDAPLLLADRDNLSAATLAQIKRLKPSEVIVVASRNVKDQNGKSAAIGNKVYSQLKGYKVTKVSGSNYFETAKLVAQKLKAKTNKSPTSVFITTDKAYADALSASPAAAVLGAPILYVDPKATLNANTKNYLSSIKKTVKNVYIVGGTVAITSGVEKQIKSVLGVKSTVRFSGADRYETCTKINTYFKGSLNTNAVCIAKGYDFPDALAGGVFAAKNKTPLLLADTRLYTSQTKYLKSKTVNKIYIFGGEKAVPSSLAQTIAKASV